MRDNALGVQLYSVRHDIAPDRIAGTVRRLAGLGFTHVEPYDILSNTDGLRAAIEGAGVVASTAHAKITELDRDAVIAAALELGVQTVVVPWVAPATLQDRAGIAALAASINDAARVSADHGIRIGYHNHDFEFRQQIEGRAAYEILVESLDPDVVLELDTYWASVGGADVFEVIPRLGDRVRLLHVKNELPDPGDPPFAGVDITGRLDEVIALAEPGLELPVVEVVVDDGDVYPVLERNARYFGSLVRS